MSGALTALALVNDIASWADSLQPASWRGIEFAVERSEVRRGRRTAVHEYPFRDTVWVEDLGRGVRSYSFMGFVVGDNCYAREKALIDASETPGSGTLVHPTLGSLEVALVSPLVTEQSADRGRAVGIRFEFIETSGQQFPSSSLDTTSLISSLASELNALTGSDFATSVVDAVEEGASVVSSAVKTVTSWAAVILNLASDASLVVSAVAGLRGNYGRYNSGRRTDLFTNISTTDDAIAAVVSVRASVSIANIAAEEAAGEIASDPASLCTALFAVSEAFRACCCDPADALRLLVNASSWSAVTTSSTAPIGSAIATTTTLLGLAAQCAVAASIALAVSDYQPSSYDDAQQVRATVLSAMDAIILNVADAGLDQTYLGLRSLRTAISLSLTQSGGTVARLMPVTTNVPRPALALAYSLYADASRSDDLIARADPVHPAFMPTSFEALST